MLHDVLGAFRQAAAARFRPETANTYYNRLKNLMENQNVINTMEQLDIQSMIDNLAKIKYKNHFSQSKNALLYFLKFNDIPLDSQYQKQIGELEKELKRKNRQLEEVSYTEVKNKINHIKNEKLKLSYKAMLCTGLRVSELSQIKKEDCEIKEKEIIFSFVGKGGEKEQTKIPRNEYANEYVQIKKMIEETTDSKNIFYSKNYLQQNAKKLDFECHDLRRIYSKLEYEKTHSKEEVKAKLRHTNTKTTEIYLNSKAKIDKGKGENEHK